MKKINLQNVVWKEGKYFVALCLNVDVSSFGKTEKEALDNLNEALALYFEDRSSHINFTDIRVPKLIKQSL